MLARADSLARDDGLNGSSLGKAGVLALQLTVKVLDGVLVPLDSFQVGDSFAQTPHLLTLRITLPSVERTNPLATARCLVYVVQFISLLQQKS
jgi:hypothetical protein